MGGNDEMRGQMKIFANKRSSRTAFQLSPVAAGWAVFISALAGSAYADEAPAVAGADAAPMQAVQVSGIRRSIEAAISVKRNSSSIVEAISAEDIGKLPGASI